MLDFTGKHAIVCGSTQGIGKTTARLLLQQGGTVTLLARNEDALRMAADELGPDRCHYAVADFSQPDQVQQAAEAVTGDRDVHILINNTGGPPAGPLQKADAAALQTAFDMHIHSSQRLLQTVVPSMRGSGYGRIVNIVSTSVREPIPGLGVSNVMRAAVAGWAKTLSRELGPDGITINNVLPGYTATGRLDKLIDGRADKQGCAPDEVANQLKANVPLGRFATPEEVAAAVVFFASPEAAYITGTSLAVDGGRMTSI